MLFNKKILRVIENGRSMDENLIRRYDMELLNQLEQSIKTEELTLMEFITLAEVYHVSYKFKIVTPARIYEFSEKNIVWHELDELYHNMTCRQLNSFKLTLPELISKFNDIFAIVMFI